MTQPGRNSRKLTLKSAPVARVVRAAASWATGRRDVLGLCVQVATLPPNDRPVIEVRARLPWGAFAEYLEVPDRRVVGPWVSRTLTAAAERSQAKAQADADDAVGLGRVRGVKS